MLEGLDIQKIIDTGISIGYKVVKIPFQLWNVAPSWVHYIVYGFIIFVTIVVGLITYIFRNKWKERWA